MKRYIIILSVFLYAVLIRADSSPGIGFAGLLMQAELNPKSVLEARTLAVNSGYAVNVLSKNNIMIDAKGIENGRVVYAVYKNFTDVYNGGYTAFYEEAIRVINFNESKIDYGNGNIVDNTGGYFDPVYTPFLGTDRYLMVTDWTGDQVYLFNAANGDLADPNFIPTANPQLQSPKHALQHPNGKQIVVSDQISDVVQRFDTNGTYLGIFAPNTGVNTSIVDNMRGIAFRPNNNILVTVGSSANQNTVQQFDSAGVHIGTFIPSGNITSPFDILIRTGDLLVSCSSGSDVVRYDLSGGFLSIFNTGTDISFSQQMHRIPGGRIAVSSFSTPNSGLTILDSTGVFVNRLTAITGNRGVFLLGNGHYMVTNSAGVHEIDSVSGSVIRTIVTGSSFQYVSYYNPDILVATGNNNSTIPGTFALYPNYPNPFNPVTKIKYQVPVTGLVKITVFDVLGNEITVPVNEIKTAGNYETVFNGAGLASGVYYYKMEAGDFSSTMKMILVK